MQYGIQYVIRVEWKCRPFFRFQLKGYSLHWIFNRVLFMFLLHSKSNRFCWVEFNFQRIYRRCPPSPMKKKKISFLEIRGILESNWTGEIESCVRAGKKWQTPKNGNFQSNERKKNIFVGAWKYRFTALLCTHTQLMWFQWTKSSSSSNNGSDFKWG